MFGMLDRRAFVSRMAADVADMKRDRLASDKIKPLADAVRDAQNAAYREGRKPTIVCVGRKQSNQLLVYGYSTTEIGPVTTIRGLRVVRTRDEDLVAVYEVRDNVWC